MLKLHDELIEELAKSLMEQNYNPVVVTNHRLYARRFLDYLAWHAGDDGDASAGRSVFPPRSPLLSGSLRSSAQLTLAQAAANSDRQVAPPRPRHVAA